jgi:ABC-type amino acid transport substrate-binding protein
MHCRDVVAGLLLGWCAATAQAGAPLLVLRTAVQEGPPPKFILGKDGLTGHCPDILHAIERLDPQLKFDIDAVAHPIRRLEQGIKNGQLDVMCAMLSTPEREQAALRLPTVLYTIRERLVARADDPVEINSYDDLAGLHELVATLPGASYVNDLRLHGIRVDTASGDSQTNLRKIVSGRLRFFYISDLTAAYFIRIEGFEGKLRILPVSLHEQPLYFWASRALDAAVVQRLEKALAALRANGELERIYRSYLIK